jgi:hypothetical protein
LATTARPTGLLIVAVPLAALLLITQAAIAPPSKAKKATEPTTTPIIKPFRFELESLVTLSD